MEKIKILDKQQSEQIAKVLKNRYKNASYYLNFKTPVDLLAAAILSAQTRDDLVNSITPKLFSRFKTASDYANASKPELLGFVKSVSFAGKKADNIIETFKIIEKKYNGKVPDKMDELVQLPGIGRKTANTILINAYGKVEGIPVDTWVIKLSYRIGFSSNTNPDKIEKDLIEKIPKEYWHNFAYVLKMHGKAICSTIPICSKCPINKLCPKNGVTKSL